MSYILDALKKSEQERRQHAAAPDLSSIHQAADAHDSPSPLRLLLWLLVVVVLGVAVWAGYLVLNNQARSPSAVQTTQVTPAPPIATDRTRQNRAAPDPQAQSLYKPDAGDGDEKVTQLYSQPEAVAPTATDTQPKAQSTDTNRLPNIRELPLSVQSQIGPMDYSAHVYSSDVSRGFAIINGKRRYREDRMENGPTVVTVLEEAIVLEFMGQLFMLDAMQSWPE
ncbi:general secretion pathway protein GspB [Simiduia agarivorans]|uniref:Type II secretion system protein GspB C-terminal domain-containing protein n=1 Tax=Simiduia agarivorans (strain DSM 21679 / JCM 13881 / BCRC 17597 / SA1) TaxID=1117647 RepID=K4KK90_SIMAS|nr:general secretion pathway protein GspB [Simiduia agarivorans]AFU99421.1 hypothetical protein M5M_11220 [Simiduia agarivorans SA1 = DSM 21679]